jgi:hypothetical protein
LRWSGDGYDRTMKVMSGSCGLRRAARRTALIAIAALALGLAAGRSALAQQYTVDSAQSTALTGYLRQHHLPLVGAQVLNGAKGAERLLLYGYVATNQGKSDARRRALAYLGSGDITVENRIVVRPEIARMKAPVVAPESQSGEPAQASAGGESLDNVLNDISRYGIKSAPDQSGSP